MIVTSLDVIFVVISRDIIKLLVIYKHNNIILLQ